mmetsp:Transcript_25624/g.59693  ORF Transcript_25624/g.59693 Transcript_25624/m.59693 type:complete len:408 (-) Transcript_25624:169-1392(-)
MAPQAVAKLARKFQKLLEEQDDDGGSIVKLLDPEQWSLSASDLQNGAVLQQAAVSQGGELGGEVLSFYLLAQRAHQTGDQLKELELLLTGLKTWVQRYIEASGPVAGKMLPLMIHMSVIARKLAISMDESKRSEGSQDQYLKKLVEILREVFQKLARERAKKAGMVWICCELLRAYFRLGQISQCGFLLKSVTQSLSKEAFNAQDLPKAISVSFYFFWGKFCVFSHEFRDADEKLTWAFNSCPAKSRQHRRNILLYLVPCKLRLGVLPTQELLQMYNLNLFMGIVKAIREGNVQLFSEKMQEHAAEFLKMGTYLLMMKLKFFVWRSLCKGIHHVVGKKLPEKDAHKMDLAKFEHVFQWQDDCDADETACMLANLIYSGAVKGYLSHEHRKLVFAKDNPFPPPAKWKM